MIINPFIFGAGASTTPYDRWVSRIDAAGGTYEVDSKTIASDLFDALFAETYYAKIKYLLPLLGADIIAARVPLIDTLGVGIATNTGFIDADFDQAVGLDGGTSKYLDLLVYPSQLNSGLVGGIGFNEGNAAGSQSGTDTVPIGCYNTANSLIRWNIDLRAASVRTTWGLNTNAAIAASAVANGHYYAQSAGSADRKLYKDATQIASNTSSESAAPETAAHLCLMGTPSPSAGWYSGRCRYAYMTDGTLSSGDITALDALLGTYLLTPTGR